MNGGTTVAVIGTGLMGGSLGMAMRSAGAYVRGYDLDAEVLSKAVQLGAVDMGAEDATSAATGADIVFIAGPVDAIPRIYDSMAPGLSERCIVTDIGSTKMRIVDEIQTRGTTGFIGGHPIAGGEQEGIESARPDLFHGCYWILTPTEQTDPSAYGVLVRFLGSLGVKVLSLDPARHDELVALTSHLPQVLASLLMGFTSEVTSQEGGLPMITAGGFHDMTRIAASSPALWVEILKENASAIDGVLKRFEEALSKTRLGIQAGSWEDVGDLLRRAQQARKLLSSKPAVKGVPLTEVIVEIPDAPGALASITTAMGEAGTNIEDLEIHHAAEGGRGSLRLLIDGASVEKALAAVRSKGFRASVGWTDG